jgi:hypothetical protein
MAGMSAQNQQRITDRVKDAVRWKVIPRKVQVYVWTWLGSGRFTCELQTYEDGQAAWNKAREEKPWTIRVNECYGVCEIAKFFSQPRYALTLAPRVYKPMDDSDSDSGEEEDTSPEALRYMKETSAVLREIELNAIIAFEQTVTCADSPGGSPGAPHNTWFTNDDFAPAYIDQYSPRAFAQDSQKTTLEDNVNCDSPASSRAGYALSSPRRILIAEDDEIEIASASDVLHGMLGFRWLGPNDHPLQVLAQYQVRAAGNKHFINDLAFVWKILGYGGTFPGDQKASLSNKSNCYGLDKVLGGELLTFISDLEFFGWDLKQAKSKNSTNALVEQEALMRARTAMPAPDTYIHHPLAWDRTWSTMQERGLRCWTVSRAVVLLPSDDLVSPPRETPAYAVHQRSGEGGHHSVPPLVLFDAMAVWHFLCDSGNTFTTYRRIIQYCVNTGVRFCLPSREESRPTEVTSKAASTYKDDLLARRASTRPGYTRDFIASVSSDMVRAWYATVANLLRDPRIARACLRQGGLVWRISRMFLHSEPAFDEASLDARQFQVRAQITWRGVRYWDNVLEAKEEATILGSFMGWGKDTNGERGVNVRYWLFLPSRAWDSLFMAGAWTPAAEQWFQGTLKRYRDLELQSGPPPKAKKTSRRMRDWEDSLQDCDKHGCRVWHGARHQAKMHLDYRVNEDAALSVKLGKRSANTAGFAESLSASSYKSVQ